MPEQMLKSWHEERTHWMLEHGLNPAGDPYPDCLQRLKPSLRREFHRRFSDRWHQHLDDGHGACVLQQPRLAKVVADSLHHFDGDRYYLSDYVIMPNHVHLLTAFVDEAALLAQYKSWKHFTATQINRFMNKRGRFWQQDGFDHLVRSEEQFQFLRKYIKDNPVEAHLNESQYLHFAKP